MNAMADETPQDTLTIDPVAMNIVNRVAAGCDLSGDLRFDGGLLVQGQLHGDIRVQGRLVVWAGAFVSGRIRVVGDLYLFGHLGLPDGAPQDTILECEGTVIMGGSGVSTGTLAARRLQMYEGAQMKGPLRTAQSTDRLPVLRDVVAPPPPREAEPGPQA